MSQANEGPQRPPPAPGGAARRPAYGLGGMVLACAGIGVLVCVLIWTVPRFEAFFADSGAALPGPTRAVFQASRLVRASPGVFLPLAGLVMAGLICLPILVRRRVVRVIGPVLLTLLIGAVLAIILSLYVQLVRLAGEMR